MVGRCSVGFINLALSVFSLYPHLLHRNLLITGSDMYTVRSNPKKKLQRSDPTIGTSYPRQVVEQNTRKLSKTFVPYDVSICCFLGCCLVCSPTHVTFAPEFFFSVKYAFTIIRLCNSFVNRLIYSLRKPMLRQSLRRFRLVKTRKQRKTT